VSVLINFNESSGDTHSPHTLTSTPPPFSIPFSGASVYSFNGTEGGAFGSTAPGFIDVVNAPATQKEDGKHNPLPSEFMVVEAGKGAGGVYTFRVAQRVGSTWGTVLGMKNFTC